MANTWKVYMLAIVSFVVGTSEFIIAGILNEVAQDIGVTLSAAGQLISVFSLSYAFGTPILMALTARMDRRRLLLAALAAFAAGSLIVVFIPGFEALVASRILLALSTGVFVVTAMTVVSNTVAPEKRGSAIATLVMGFSTSLIIGVPLGRVIASAYDWKMNFAGTALLAVLAIPAVAMAIPRTKGEAPVPLRSQLALLKRPRIVIALAVTFFWIGGYSIAYTYISPFLTEVTGMGGKAVSIGLFAFGIASLIGSKLGGFGTDRWGYAPTLLGGMLLHAVSLILLSLAAHSPAAMFPLLMLWAFAAWSSGPTQQYHLLAIAPEASGIMLSLNTSVLQLAMAAGAGLGGIVVEQASLSAVTWIAAGAVAGAALVVGASLGLFRSRRGGESLRRPVAPEIGNGH